MNRIKNNKSKFKILLFTVAAVLLFGGAAQSSLATQGKGKLNKSKGEKQATQFDDLSNNNALTTLNTQKTKSEIKIISLCANFNHFYNAIVLS